MAGLALGATGFIITSTQSCVAVATTVGLPIIKKILIGGITKGLGIFKNKESFLANGLIDKALPEQLKSINSTLEKIGLNNLVTKEKSYIADAAAFIAPIAEPILVNTVQNMTSEDAQKIANGGKGAATAYLREKVATQLMSAIAPKVDAKLNEYGIVKTINTALQGNSFLGALTGNQTSTASSSLSKLASEQLVNGLFNIIENHENTSPENPLNFIK